MNKLYNTPFISLLPDSITGDATIQATCAALDGMLVRVAQSVPNLLVYSRLLLTAGRIRPFTLLPALQRIIDASGGLKTLSMPELELLAWQFHVDFRELARTDVQLAKMVLQAIQWHRSKGTPASLINALALFGYAAIIEEDGVGQHWATYQLGLPQIADVTTVQKILSIAKEMQPTRCRLWRIYTDAFDRRPVIWSGGNPHDCWSDGWWTMHSGVPVPDAPGSEDDLIVSFGTRNAYQSEAYNPGDACGSFGATTHYGFLAPYIDRPIWSRSAWSDVFPRNHGFAMNSLFSILWADRATTGRRWRGEWDARSWLDYTGFDRKLPQWRMGQRALSRSQQAYSGGNRLSDINACYSRPSALLLDAPPVWGSSRWSAEGSKLHLLVIDERYISVSTMAPKPVNPGIPQAAGASLLAITAPVPDAQRAQQARHDEITAHMRQREAVPPRTATILHLGTESVPVIPCAAPPSAVTHHRAPQWLGAWNETGRTWWTETTIFVQ